MERQEKLREDRHERSVGIQQGLRMLGIRSSLEMEGIIVDENVIESLIKRMGNLERETLTGDLSADAISAFLMRVNSAPPEPTFELRAARNLATAYTQLGKMVQANTHISEKDIKDLHITIMSGQHLPLSRIGTYCYVPKIILNAPIDSVAPFLDPSQIDEEMARLVPDFNESLYRLDPTQPIQIIESAANFHWRFGQIHPFADGNGRLARLGNDAILQANGLYQIPHWTNDKAEGRAAKRKDYYTAIRDSQIQASDVPLARFLARGQIDAIDLDLQDLSQHSSEFVENRMRLREDFKSYLEAA